MTDEAPARNAAPRLSPQAGSWLSICKVWDSEYPWDVRAEKVARALTEAGHSVNMVARNRRRESVREDLPEATVYRLSPWRWVPSALSAASSFPAFLNPRWLHAIRRVAQTTNADLILCRDLPLAPACIAVARALAIPIVLDMAENYPAMLKSRWDTGRRKPLDILVRNPRLARLVEEWTLPRVDGVLVVVEESGDRIAGLGVNRDRIAVVCNTPPLQRVDAGQARHLSSGPLRIVYLGLIEAQRGLGELLDAVALLKDRSIPVELTVYGDGLDGAYFRRRAKQRGLDPPVVTFRGWIPNHVALSELPNAQVGVIPHWRDESWNTTIPNKLFDYMAAGLPVVTSDARPAARIVEASGCGRVFRNRDVGDLARSLEAFLSPEARLAAGQRGRGAVRRQYNWEADTRRMLGLLERVTHGGRSPAASSPYDSRRADRCDSRPTRANDG